jgi:GntR family transcriptional regulator/MocR family aminotransferase
MREAIAGHLRRARGLAAGPDDLVITAGAAEAFHLIARLLVRPGDHVAVEDPGYPMARLAFEAAGGVVVPVGVDKSGLKVDALKRARLVYVTPSHQFPTGVRMTLARRRQLLAWAEDHDALVVEDDYDGEFRFDGPPLPPLASLAGAERVAYVGTFSKTLTPTVRLGFVAAPQLAMALAQPSSTIMLLAFRSSPFLVSLKRASSIVTSPASAAPTPNGERHCSKLSTRIPLRRKAWRLACMSFSLLLRAR